jgi:hypothetical protein
VGSNRKERKQKGSSWSLPTHDGTVARFGVRTRKRRREKLEVREKKEGKGSPHECSHAGSLALNGPGASVFMGHESLF